MSVNHAHKQVNLKRSHNIFLEGTMFKKKWNVLFVIALCALFVQPVMAASGDEQGGGGVRFGPYTLESGNTTSGDLVVFGGPVTLEEDSVFDGDLTVLGELTIEEGAALDGQLVVLGNASVAGLVDGDVFVAGPISLDESAYIDGDLSVVGQLSQEDGAIVEGEIIPIDEDDWDFPININVPRPIVVPEVLRSEDIHVPFWLKTLTAIAQAVASVLILSLLSLVATSLWPEHIERVGRTIEEAPLVSFGTGLLTLVVAILAAVLLAITICLSPFALIGLIVVSLGVLMGWIALGLVLGRKVLSAMFNQPQPKTVLAAVVGTGLLTILIAMTQVFGALQSLLIFILVPPVAGAVLLTRFGSMPYATRGVTGVVSGTPPSAPSSPQASKPAPLPGDAVKEDEVIDVSADDSVGDDQPSALEVDATKVIELDAELIEEDELPDESLDA
jgi:cytoskeletal protein CcmA (bactofilin family)